MDSAKFKKGSKETDEALDKTSKNASKTSKDMEAWGKNAAASMSKLRNEVLGLLAVFTAGVGIKSFVENTINTTSSLGRMSANLNMSAKDLAEWQLANKNAGGSAEGMAAQFREAQMEVENYKAGFAPSPALQEFFNQGGNPAALESATKYLMDRSRLISDLYQKNSGTGEFFAGKMGISEDTFNLIKQGPEAIERLREAQSALAEEQAKASIPAEKLRQKIDALKNRFEAIGVKILTGLMPQLDRFTDWLNENQGNIKAWADKAVAAIEQFVKWADSAAQSVGGWKTVLLALLALKIGSMVTPLLLLAGALGKVGGGLGLIGTAGVAALAVFAGLQAAKALGLPDVDKEKGDADVKKGDYWAASAHLSAPDFLSALQQKIFNDTRKNGIGEIYTRTLASLGNIEAGQAIYRNTGKDDYRVGSKGAAASAIEVAQSAKLFQSLEKKYGLPAGVLDAQWLAESGRGKNMLSPKGAKGHFQFMDATAKQYGLKNPNDLAESADAAARMLRDLLKQNGGNLPAALAAYNWGQGNLAKNGFGAAPAETRNYIDQITRRMPTSRMAGNTSTSTSEIHIQKIEINTQATDADGIAQALKVDLERNLLPMLSYRGGLR